MKEGMARLYIGAAGLVVAVIALALAAIALGGVSPAASQLEPAERNVYITAVEYEYSTEVEEVPFPAVEPSTIGASYAAEWVEEGKEWEVEVYAWDLPQVVVNQGDSVKLHFFGANDDTHPSVITGYDLRFEVKMAEVTTVEFTADRPGIFEIRCDAHLPHMVSEFVVLPRP